MKVGFFAWESTWGMILMIDHLKSIEWTMPNRCYMCKNEEESIDHLLLHCPKVSILWQPVFSLFGIVWVMHSTIRKNLLSWHGAFMQKNGKKKKEILEVTSL